MNAIKISAKEIQTKLKENKKKAEERMQKAKLATEKRKIERENEKARIEKKRKEKEKRQKEIEDLIEYRFSLIDQIAPISIEAALSGNINQEIDSDVYEECFQELEDLGFTFGKTSLETASIQYLNKKLKTHTRTELKKLAGEIRKDINFLLKQKMRSYRNQLEEIQKIDDELFHCYKALIFFRRRLVESDDLEYDFMEIDFVEEPIDEKTNNEFIEFTRRVQELVEEYLPYEFNDEVHKVFLVWNFVKSDIENDYYWFNVKMLNWISSKEGSLFFKKVLKKIEEKVELLRDNISFEINEKDKISRLKFEIKDEITTPLPASTLCRIFEILGYKLNVNSRTETTHNVRLSWN
jgi:hypothetical protein